MATPVLNSTQETCAICHKDYQDKEISDVSRVVELACRHFCHIGCISKSLRDQENGQRGLTHCNQKFTSSARAANVFTGQEIFQARLEEIGEDYDYDNEVMESVSVIADLYDSLHDLSNSFSMEPNDAVVNQAEEEELGFPKAVANLVIENKAINEDLKPTVLQILAVMVAGDRALRTVDGEAERWKNVSFENWPDKIKQEGVLVRYKDEDIRMRVSANHLKKVVDKIFVDVLMNHYQKKAENFLQSIRFWTPRVLGVVTVAVLAKKALDRF
ncbi:MAG: hypothetical protein AABZ92_05220 [Verrucomicrobiota bacterium]